MLCFLPTLLRGNMYVLKRIGSRTWGSHKHDFTMSHPQQDSNLWWWSTQQRLKLSKSLSQKICTSLPSRGYRGPHQAKRLKCEHAHMHTLTKLIQWVCWGPWLLERPVGPGKTVVGTRIHNDNYWIFQMWLLLCSIPGSYRIFPKSFLFKPSSVYWMPRHLPQVSPYHMSRWNNVVAKWPS